MRLDEHRRALTWGAITVLAFAYGWWAVSLPAFSGGATVAILGGGAVAILIGTVWRRPQEPRGRTDGAGWWLVLVAMAAAWQLFAYLQDPREEHPTLSSLANAVLDSQPARAGAFVLWIVVAVGLARR